MADGGLGHVPGIEQGFIVERYGQRLHVPADAGEQCQPATQQVLRQLLADITLVAEQLADQVAGQRRDRRGVMDVARGQLQGDNFIAVVEDEVQFEAEEPAHRGLAALGQIGENLVPADAMIIADRQRGGIDVVEPGPGPQVADEEDHQRHEDTFLQGDEVLVAGHPGKVAAQQRLGETVIAALEMLEACTVNHEQKRDDLTGRHAARVAPARRGPTATPPIAAQTPGKNHRPRKKPRRSDPTSSPPSLSDRRLPQKAFQSQSLSRAKTPYPGYQNPTGRSIQALGISPDVVVEQRQVMLTDDKVQVSDYQLPRALDIVRGAAMFAGPAPAA